MTKNTEGHSSYLTQSIVYPEMANGFGPRLVFQGPLISFQGYDTEIYFAAEVMKEYKDNFLTSKDPAWKISAVMSCYMKYLSQEIKTEMVFKKQRDFA